MKIRIIKPLKSDAPEEARAAWVGVELTVVFRLAEGGYAVDGPPALAALKARSPEAAAWWGENRPNLFGSQQGLIVSADVCELAL